MMKLQSGIDILAEVGDVRTIDKARDIFKNNTGGNWKTSTLMRR